MNINRPKKLTFPLDRRKFELMAILLVQKGDFKK
jgi:hypothetical protein